MPQLFTLNYLYVIPIVKKFTGAGDKLLNGWQLGGIYVAQSGLPFTPTIAGDAQTKAPRLQIDNYLQQDDQPSQPGQMVAIPLAATARPLTSYRVGAMHSAKQIQHPSWGEDSIQPSG